MGQDFWNGGSTPSSLKVSIRDTTNGAVSLTVNGVTYSGTIATATDDGVVTLEATGLSGGIVYPYTVVSPSATSSGENKTQPSSGPTRLIALSCQANGQFNGAFIRKYQPNCLIHTGDESYGEDFWFAGATKTNILDPDQHYGYQYVSRTQQSGKTKYTHFLPFVHVVDDHDGLHNDFYDDVANANTFYGFSTALDAADWVTVKNNMCQALDVYDGGRPAPYTSTTDSNPLYFDFISGNCHVIVLAQCVQSVTPQVIRSKYGIAGNLLASAQMQWAKDALTNSPCTFKLICTPKAIMGVSNAQTDSWVRYDTPNGIGGTGSSNGYADWDTLPIWIEANSASWNVPGGVGWVGGDHHSPGMYGGDNAVTGLGFDLAYWNASAYQRVGDVRDADLAQKIASAPWALSYVSENSGGPMVTDRYRSPSDSPNVIGYMDCFALVDTTDDYMEVSLMSRFTGEKFPGFSGRVLAGENKLSAPPLKVAI